MEPIRRRRKPRPEQAGELNPRAKLSRWEVQEILGRADGGESYAAIAEAFGISATQVSRIHREKQWLEDRRELG